MYTFFQHWMQCPACFYSQSILTTTMRCHSTFSKVTKLRSWLCPSVNSGNQSLALSMTHSASISFSLLEWEPWTSISSSCEFPAQLPGKTTLSPTAFWEGQQCRGSSEDSLGVPVEFRLTALEGLPRRFSLFSASFMLILKKKKLAAPGLSWSSSLTRDWTWLLCIGSVES